MAPIAMKLSTASVAIIGAMLLVVRDSMMLVALGILLMGIGAVSFIKG